jgi:hypothetical protein
MAARPARPQLLRQLGDAEIQQQGHPRAKRQHAGVAEPGDVRVLQRRQDVAFSCHSLGQPDAARAAAPELADQLSGPDGVGGGQVAGREAEPAATLQRRATS